MPDDQGRMGRCRRPGRGSSWPREVSGDLVAGCGQIQAFQGWPATVEELPYDDGTFDLVLAQLVIHFMTDPVAGLAQLARVAAPGGIVAANVWDFGGHRGPLSPWAWGRQGTTWPRSTRRRAWRCADAVGTSFPPTRSRSALPLGQRCGTSRTDCTREVERAGTTRLT